MIKLKSALSLSSKVPYITDDGLDDYAVELIQDFAPEFLHTPMPFDIEKFILYYLNLKLYFEHIRYYQKMQGVVAFHDGVIQIIDVRTGKALPYPVKKGSVILDASLSLKRNEQRRRFSCGHEGSHWLLHRDVFSPDNPFSGMLGYQNQMLAAKKGTIDYSRCLLERTDGQRIERQADYLSSAILMNRFALRQACHIFFKYHNEKARRIIRGVNMKDDCLAEQLPAYIAEIFNVSKRAALIRLEKLTEIVDKGFLQNEQYRDNAFL